MDGKQTQLNMTPSGSFGRVPAAAVPQWGIRVPRARGDEPSASLSGRLAGAPFCYPTSIPYDDYRKVLQISSAHVCLTYPFVLSWSMLEAMASGCLVIGSATLPVQEVIRHQENGLLVDFFENHALANTITQVLQLPNSYQAIRQAANEQAHLLYSHKHGLAAYLRLIRQ